MKTLKTVLRLLARVVSRLIAGLLVGIVAFVPLLLFILVYWWCEPQGVWRMIFILLGSILTLITEIVWMIMWAFQVGFWWEKIFHKPDLPKVGIRLQ